MSSGRSRTRSGCSDPPNGSHYNNPAKVKQLKRMGAEQKGAPDMFVFKQGFDGLQLAIEFTHGKNVLSPRSTRRTSKR